MCTSIACGRQASEGGVVLIARNEDYPENNWNKYMKYRIYPPYTRGQDKWQLGNGLTVPTPENFFAYCSMPDAQGAEEAVCDIGDHFLFEARGINEKDVAVTATNSMQANEKALAADPFVSSSGIEESVIATLLLPQAENARHAVRLLGQYVTEYGAAEANGVLMADEKEAWYFEIGSCRHWIAVRIPDDKYLVVSNSMRIHDVDLTDTEHVLSSDGLYNFVIEHGLLEHPSQSKFDFASAFGQQEKSESGQTDRYYNTDRIWLAQSILSPSQKPEIRQDTYELFLAPDEPITPAHVMKVLRSTFQGTPLEHEPDATRPIGVVRTLQSHIMTVDGRLSAGLKGVVWQAVGSPLCSVYVPFYALADEIPDAYASGDSTFFTENSIWWIWRGLFALADQMDRAYGQNKPDKLDGLLKYCRNWERYFIKMQTAMNEILEQTELPDVPGAKIIAKAYSTNNLKLMADAAMQKYQLMMAELSGSQKDR